MTVHKSQGSEFDHVVLILPDKDYPLLTRELIYTALTRGRQAVTIWGTESVLKTAIKRKIERTSGLREALWTNDRPPAESVT
jgi:exodeoxyribonuclease V alpha subunit